MPSLMRAATILCCVCLMVARAGAAGNGMQDRINLKKKVRHPPARALFAAFTRAAVVAPAPARSRGEARRGGSHRLFLLCELL